MYLVNLLLLAVSVFYLGCGLWIGYRDLYPFRPDETTVSTTPDEELPIFDQVNLGPAGAWSLLLHAGIIGVLLLVGDIPPGIRRFPARDRMATAKDFYVFMASLPEERKSSPKTSPPDHIRPPLQAAAPALPALTATRVVAQARTKPPAPSQPGAVRVAPVGDSTIGDPPRGAVAKKVPTKDKASSELSRTPQRIMELFAVRALKPSPEHLEPTAPLLSFIQEAEPEPSRVQSGATPPAPKAAPDSAPLRVPDSPGAPTQLLEEGPALFPPPGTVVGARSPAPSSLVASADPRPSVLEPTEGRQGTTLTELEAPKALPASPMQETTPLRERSSSTAPSLWEPKEVPLGRLEAAPPEGPPVASLSLGGGTKLFPAPGTMVAAQPATRSSPVDSAAPSRRQRESPSLPIIGAARVSAREPPAGSQETRLAEAEAPAPFAAAEPVREPALLPPMPKVSPPIPEGELLAELAPSNGTISLESEGVPSPPQMAQTGMAPSVPLQKVAALPTPAPSVVLPPPGQGVEATSPLGSPLLPSSEGMVRTAEPIQDGPPPMPEVFTPAPEMKPLPFPSADATLQGPDEVPGTHLGSASAMSEEVPDPGPLASPDGPVADPIEEATPLPLVPEISPPTSEGELLAELAPSNGTISLESEAVPPPPQMVQTELVPPVPASAFFPPPGAVLAARDVTVSVRAHSATPRAPAPEPTEIRQGTNLAKLQALRTLPVSPRQEAGPGTPVPKVSPPTPEEEPLAKRVPFTDPSPLEPEQIPDTRLGAASSAPQVVLDPAPLAAPDGLDEGPVRVAAVRLPTSEPPAGSLKTYSSDTRTPDALPADATLQEPEEAPFDHSVESPPVSQAAPESPPVPAPDGVAVAAQPVEAGPALFPSPGTVVGVQPAATPSSPVDSPEPGEPVRVLASVSPTPGPPAVRQETNSAELQAPPEALSASPIQQAEPQPSMPQGAPPSVVVKPLPEPAPSSGAGPVGFPLPGTVMAARLIASREATPGSPAGQGFGRLEVRLDGPRSRVTDHEIETVSGKILGGVPVHLVVYANNTAKDVVADGGSFEVSVSLRRGLNHLRAVAKDWRGIETEDTIAVKYVPPPVPNGIAITSPRDGYTLPPDAPPVILVEGQVEDWDVSTVWLVANDRRIAVRAHDGRFRKALPLLGPVLHMWAELPPNGKPPQRSQGVTVHAGSASPSHGLLLVDWPQGVASDQVKVKATWRAHPERLDVPIRTVPLRAFGASTRDSLPEIFTLRMKPGVYTFLLRARAVSTGNVRPILYLPEAGHLKARELRMVSLNGMSEVVLAKILFPQGVLWEQDEWFTGQSESADTVTKFRFPEGISWTERKGG